MTVVTAILAQSVSIDQITNRLSVFNVIEGIQADRFPVVMQELVFVAVLRREGNDPARFNTTLTVQIDETPIGRADLIVDFEDKPNTRLVGTFQGMPITGPGRLQFIMALPNTDPVTLSIQVMHTPVPAAVQ